jgi:Holliday junction DNA helicase RuvA
MYDTIEGPIRAVNGDVLTIKAGGIGYAVRVTPALVRELLEHKRDQIELWLHYQLLPDHGTAMLYGFISPTERAFFHDLCRLPGCGPATALKVMGAGIDAIKALVRAKDTSGLRKLPGIGPKMADRLVQEFK